MLRAVTLLASLALLGCSRCCAPGERPSGGGRDATADAQREPPDAGSGSAAPGDAVTRDARDAEAGGAAVTRPGGTGDARPGPAGTGIIEVLRGGATEEELEPGAGLSEDEEESVDRAVDTLEHGPDDMPPLGTTGV
jgi:hypothetical protein